MFHQIAAQKAFSRLEKSAINFQKNVLHSLLIFHVPSVKITTNLVQLVIERVVIAVKDQILFTPVLHVPTVTTSTVQVDAFRSVLSAMAIIKEMVSAHLAYLDLYLLEEFVVLQDRQFREMSA